MDFVGKSVIHKNLGNGTVSSTTDKNGFGYITIVFPTKTTTLVFPQCVKDGFIHFADDAFHQQVLAAIQETEKPKQIDPPKPEPVPEPIAPAKPKKPATAAPKTKLVRPVTRIRGRQIFLVHQGKTYSDEAKGGYIWAPISTKSGTKPHHWTLVQDVRPGDVIYHSVNGEIVALSVAKTAGYECNQPPELQSQDAWELSGRRADCEYTEINSPIKTLSYKKELIHYSYLKYSPFNVKGEGNQGYLFGLNKTLARMFLKDLVKNNHYLEKLDYVQDILSEAERYVKPKLPELADYLKTLDDLANETTETSDGAKIKVDWVRVEIPLLNISLRPGTLVDNGRSIVGAAITAVYEKDERDPKKVKSWYKQDLVSCIQKLCDGLHDASETTLVIDTEEFQYK